MINDVLGGDYMKEKISVISSYDFVKHEVNYGSLFQYFALQESLKKRGHQVEWIRFVYKRSFIKKLYEELLKIFKDSYYSNKICLSKFKRFITEHLQVTSKEYNSGNDIRVGCVDTTVFITGSDQVWGGPIEENFLTFANGGQKKISYAASFGRKNLEKEMIDIITPWIASLDYVSLREQSGKDICDYLGRSDSVVVPDPTILLHSYEYPVKTMEIEQPYIFGYFLNLKDENTLPLNSIKCYLDSTQKYDFISCVTSGTKIVPDILKQGRVFPSPEEWLGYYQNAKIIFTNSFHGTVFSLIFRKPFVVFLQNGITGKQNERIFNLLNTFNLIDRIYDSQIRIENILEREIDWEYVSKIMEDQKIIASRFFEDTGL